MLKQILIITITLLTFIKADLPPEEGYHVDTKETHITNINHYSEYEILGCVISRMGTTGCYKISDNQSITKGYKYNEVHLIAIKKEALSSLGGIDATNLKGVENANDLSKQIAQYTIDKKFKNIETIGISHIKDDNTISSEKYFYEITSIKNSVITLKLKSRELSFTDGRADTTINY